MNKVYLVGAGTGRGMLTLRGAELLKICDCVVYDSLLSEEILSLCPPACERIFVGKRAGKHSAEQGQINEILAACGKKYPVTVRLKGGDPFVFGRGGEEMQALRAAGIACEAVPGVTGAVAAAELAGIPVTHRGVSRGFTVLAAHTAEGVPDFSEYGKSKETLVFLMSKAAAGDIMRGLIGGGMAADMPAALISAAGTEKFVCKRGALCELETLAAVLPAPLTIIVGKVCALDFLSEPRGQKGVFREEMQGDLSAEKAARGGAKVCVTGTPAHVSRVCSLLRSRGVFAENCAFLRPERLDFGGFFDKMQKFRWLVFTSENGVRLFFAEVKRRGADLRAFGDKKFAVIGPHTAQCLLEYGFTADCMPETYTAAALTAALSGVGASRKTTALLRAKQGGGQLAGAGEQFAVYELVPDAAMLAKAEKFVSSADVVTFGSAFGATCLLERCSLKAGAAAVCIGEETAKVLRARGYSPIICESARAEELARLASAAARERS